MRTYFRSHRKLLFLRQAYHLHAVCRGTVAEMKPYFGFLRKQDISCRNHIFHRIRNPFQSKTFCILICIHHALFHQRLVLTMGKHGNPAVFCLLHALPVQRSIHHRFAVFANGMAACLCHPADVCQLFPLLPFCDCPKLNHMGKRFPFRPLMYPCHLLPVVHDRLRIGHGAHGRHAALYRRPAAGGKGLFVLKARIPEMHMQVNQPRHHIAAFGIDDTVGILIYLFCNLLYPAILNENVVTSVLLCQRIDYMPILN